MYEFRIITQADGKTTLWAYGTIKSDDCRGMLEIVQFMLDSADTIEDFSIIIRVDGGNTPGVRLPLSDLIAIYGMYKRDFHERLKNKPTWNKQTFDMKEVSLWG